MKLGTLIFSRKVLTVLSVLIFSFVLFCSCGSTWNIEGNNMYIQKVDRDTVAPAGTFIVFPDSSMIPHE